MNMEIFTVPGRRAKRRTTILAVNLLSPRDKSHAYKTKKLRSRENVVVRCAASTFLPPPKRLRTKGYNGGYWLCWE
jgi:hypothetical protein